MGSPISLESGLWAEAAVVVVDAVNAARAAETSQEARTPRLLREPPRPPRLAGPLQPRLPMRDRQSGDFL